MENQTTNKNTDARKKDMLLVSGILIFNAICCIAVMAGMFTWLQKKEETANANATATKSTIVTQQANATATAVIRSTEQAQYDLVDTFKNNNTGWLTRLHEDDEYMEGSVTIYDGIYRWDIRKVKQPFYWSSELYSKGDALEDFDIYVDTKITNASPSGACSGFVFRQDPKDWYEGSYTFSVCNDAHFGMKYYDKGQPEQLAWIYNTIIRSNDWNRIEISARGSHFKFIINNMVVYEMDDDRLKSGGLSLLIDINETDSALIWFDNFGFQSR